MDATDLAAGIARLSSRHGTVRGRVALDGSALSDSVRPGLFAERVYAVVRRIPYGRVTTYGHIALLINAPRCPRQVGQALHALPRDLAWRISTSATPRTAKEAQHDASAYTSAVPWHRVVNARGRVSLRGDGGALAVQVALLRSEGIVVTEEGALEGGLEPAGWFPEYSPVETDHRGSGMLFGAAPRAGRERTMKTPTRTPSPRFDAW